jgi:F-type H+-transporting ATPase subunit b
MQIIENIALITINETLIFQLLSFFLLVYILNRIMIRPLLRVRSEREALLDRISGEINTTENRFDQISHEIEAQENAARKAAFKIRNKIEANGQQAADEIMAKARKEIDTLKIKAHEDMSARLAAARQEIQKEAAAISDRMIASLLGRRSAS